MVDCRGPGTLERSHRQVFTQEITEDKVRVSTRKHTNTRVSLGIRLQCQNDPVKGHVAAGFHSNQARTGATGGCV